MHDAMLATICSHGLGHGVRGKGAELEAQACREGREGPVDACVCVA